MISASHHGKGPSPRARGADGAHVDVHFTSGTIPVCAGSSSSGSPARVRPWDHPRVRGEQIESVVTTTTPLGPSSRARGAVPPGITHHTKRGLSPRARGAEDRAHGMQRPPRTIPACAGSSSPRTGRSAERRDHPRVRGEQAAGRKALISALGPSPRARGADPAGLHRARPRGTIPACAGSSRTSRAGRMEETWTIPACAGSSSTTLNPNRSSRDHPRVRGEQTPRPAGLPGRGAVFEYFLRVGQIGRM